MCLVTVCSEVGSGEMLSPALHPVLVTSCPLVCECPHTSRFAHAPEGQGFARRRREGEENGEGEDGEEEGEEGREE